MSKIVIWGIRIRIWNYSFVRFENVQIKISDKSEHAERIPNADTIVK